jgi:hypothetical protein
MRIATFGSALWLTLFAATAMAPLPDVTSAYAKGGDHGAGNGGAGNGGAGNGGAGKGAGSGNGGGNSGHSANDAGGSSGRGKGGSGNINSSSGPKGRSETDTQRHEDTSKTNRKADTTEKGTAAQMAGLNGLNRNYRALLHTSDPRMAEISAYSTAYARYELRYGVSPSADDPVLGDDALAAALSSATRKGSVSPAVLERAKAILGVGDAFGKIDQIRYSMKPRASDRATYDR